jgi:hypothetical protein
MTAPNQPGWDVRLQLADLELAPGERRRLGLVFLNPEGAETLRRAGHFYLWEGKIVGEASVIA